MDYVALNIGLPGHNSAVPKYFPVFRIGTQTQVAHSSTVRSLRLWSATWVHSCNATTMTLSHCMSLRMPNSLHTQVPEITILYRTVSCKCLIPGSVSYHSHTACNTRLRRTHQGHNSLHHIHPLRSSSTNVMPSVNEGFTLYSDKKKKKKNMTQAAMLHASSASLPTRSTI